MAINKNFVVKNGLEVSGNLIFANATDKKVGIGTTNSQFTLGVHGGIGVTDLYVSDGATILGNFNLGNGGEFLKLDSSTGMIGIGTDNPQYMLDLRSNVSTGQTSLYVKGDVDITGTCKTQKLESIDLDVSGAVSFNTANFASISITNGATLGPNSNLQVNGTSSFANDASFSQDVNIADDLTVAGSVDITTNIVVDGTATFGNSATFDNTITAKQISNNALSAYKAEDINGTRFNVTGAGVLSLYDNTLTENVTISSDGSATFAGTTIVGSDPDAISNSGCKLYASGTIRARSTSSTSSGILFEGFGAGQSSSQFKVTADGSATFGGDMVIGSQNSDSRITIGSHGTAGTNDSVHMRADGENLLFMSGSGGITKFEQNGTQRFAINADGSSTFGGIVDADGVKIGVGIVTASTNSGIVTYYGDGSKLSNVGGSVAIEANGTSIGTDIETINFSGTPVSADSSASSGVAEIKLVIPSPTNTSDNVEMNPILKGSDDTTYYSDLLQYNPSTGKLSTDGRAIPYSVVSNTAPVTRANGDFWTDTSVTPSILKVWTGSEWTETGSGDVSELTDSNGDIRVGVTTTGAAVTGDILINWDSTDNESGVMIGEMDTPEVDANGNVITYSSIVVNGRDTNNIAFGTYDGVANKYTSSISHSGFSRFKQLGIHTGNSYAEDGSINLFRYEKDENDTIVSDNQIQVIKSRDRDDYPVIYSTILESDSTTKTEYMVRANGQTSIGMDFTDYKKGLFLTPSDTGNKSAIYIHGDGSSTGTALGVYNGTSQKYMGGINHDGTVYGARATIGDLTVGGGNGSLNSTAALGYDALENNTGNWNIGIGNVALTNNTVGTSNVAIGDGAMRDNKASSNCVAIGGGAGRWMTDAASTTPVSRQNTYVGHFAGSGTESSVSTNTGKWNTGVGANSMYNITTGEENACFGYNSGAYITTGSYNSLVGAYSGRGTADGGGTPRAITGDGNTAFGQASLYKLKTGSNNTSIGTASLYENDDGNVNTAVGNQAMYYNRGRSQGTAVGYYSQRNCDSTDAEEINYNVSVGAWCLTGSDSPGSNTGNENTAVGYSAGYSMTSGGFNVAIGTNCLRNMSTANQNTAVGYRSMFTTVGGSWNAAMGYYALHDAVSAESCTAIGYYALKANTANENTACGSYALANNVSGAYNTAVGRIAGRDVNSENNTCIGYAAGYQIQTGGNNCAIGALSGMGISGAGTYNIAIGHQTLQAQGAFNYTIAMGQGAGNQNKGNYNTALGSHSLRFHNQTGDMYNTALGAYAGSANDSSSVKPTSGQRSTYLGAYSGWETNYNEVTCVGYGAQAEGDYEVILGRSGTEVHGYAAYNSRSDARDKADIRDTILGLDFIKAIRPVDFRWDYRDAYYDIDPDTGEWTQYPIDGSRKRNRYHHGVIAQEVKEVLDEKGIDFGGYVDRKVNGGNDVLSMRYTEFVGPMIKSIQELSAENEALKEKLEDVMARLDAANI